jgi:ClpX C4-type zinc finger
MSSQDSDARPRTCSFCRQEFPEARGVVDGPDGVAICIACLGRCMESVRFRNAYCSFCRRDYREVGPLVEGPNWVYICGACIELCGRVLEQERQRPATGPESQPT